MLIARRSATTLGTDPVAQSFRNFINSSARLESQPHSTPAVGVELNLAALYPAIFASEPQRVPAVLARGAKPALISAATAALAAIVAIWHR